MGDLRLQFLNSSSEDDIENQPNDLPVVCPEIEQKTNENKVITRSAKRLRNAENLPSPQVSEVSKQPTERLLKSQLEIQTKLYDAVSKSLQDNQRTAKSMQYNTRRMYEALERISTGSLNFLRVLEAQNIEEARHHRAMENFAKKELQINQKLLELKLKRLEMLRKDE